MLYIRCDCKYAIQNFGKWIFRAVHSMSDLKLSAWFWKVAELNNQISYLTGVAFTQRACIIFLQCACVMNTLCFLFLVNYTVKVYERTFSNTVIKTLTSVYNFLLLDATRLQQVLCYRSCRWRSCRCFDLIVLLKSTIPKFHITAVCHSVLHLKE